MPKYFCCPNTFAPANWTRFYLLRRGGAARVPLCLLLLLLLFYLRSSPEPLLECQLVNSDLCFGCSNCLRPIDEILSVTRSTTTIMDHNNENMVSF